MRQKGTSTHILFLEVQYKTQHNNKFQWKGW